jgi:hypothetical protein
MTASRALGDGGSDGPPGERVEPLSCCQNRERVSRFRPRLEAEHEAPAGVADRDFLPFEGLLTVLSTPYEDQPAFRRYADPPRTD